MFGTIILDAYELSQTGEIAAAIEEICSPMDTVGWASAGVYCFWNYDSNETLYIGLASDLAVRFKQHNGIYQIDDAACKYQQIQAYFNEHRKLGYTIFVQSPLSQPIVQRNEGRYRKFLDKPKGLPIGNYAGEEGSESIRLIEGQLIEACKIATGDIPEWNKIGGDRYGSRQASLNNYGQVVKAFSYADTQNPLVSRSTIRELAENPTFEWFESQLHGLRMMMLSLRFTFEAAMNLQIKLNPYFEEQMDRMISEGYLEKVLIV